MKKYIIWIVLLIIQINVLYLCYQVRDQKRLLKEIIHCDTAMWSSQIKLDCTIYDKLRPLYHKDTINNKKFDSLFKLIK